MPAPPIATEDLQCPHCESDLARQQARVMAEKNLDPLANPELLRRLVHLMRTGQNYYDVWECHECGRDIPMAGTQELADEHWDEP